MDKSTAQALHELATTGRLSDDSTEAVHKALGVHVDDDSGLTVPDDAKAADDGKSSSTRKP